MKKTCAWCKGDMGTIPGPDDKISHGICDDCVDIHFPVAAAYRRGIPTYHGPVKVPLGDDDD